MNKEFETLNADVSAEQARAIHRVIRAMHDGECPRCGHVAPAEEFYEQEWFQHEMNHTCPSCAFTVSAEERQAAIKLFRPHMLEAYRIFTDWKSKIDELKSQTHEGITAPRTTMLEQLLLPGGEVPYIGPERRLMAYRGPVEAWLHESGSYRYRYTADDNEAIGGMQVMSPDGKHGVIANVYVKPEARGQRVASFMIRTAQQPFDTLTMTADSSPAARALAEHCGVPIEGEG